MRERRIKFVLKMLGLALIFIAGYSVGVMHTVETANEWNRQDRTEVTTWQK